MTIKIELKSIKVDRRASEETTAYSAKLFVDGRHVCDVANSGTGGADRMIGCGKGLDYGQSSRLYDEACRRVAAEMPKQNLADPGEPENLADDSMDFLCARLVGDFEIAKTMAKDLRRNLLFYASGLPGEGATAPLMAIRMDSGIVDAAGRVRAKHPDAWILNEHDEAQALEAYKRMG